MRPVIKIPNFFLHIMWVPIVIADTFGPQVFIDNGLIVILRIRKPSLYVHFVICIPYTNVALDFTDDRKFIFSFIIQCMSSREKTTNTDLSTTHSLADRRILISSLVTNMETSVRFVALFYEVHFFTRLILIVQFETSDEVTERIVCAKPM